MRFGVGLVLLFLAAGFVGADEKDEKARRKRKPTCSARFSPRPSTPTRSARLTRVSPMPNDFHLKLTDLIKATFWRRVT